MMARFRVHAVIVYCDVEESDDPPFLWGVVTDADLVAAAAVDDVETRTAGASAKSPLVTIARHETLKRAVELMREHQATHLVVVSPASERPLGIVSTLDIARELALEPNNHVG
jgi:CBS domain-containing protein